MFALFRLSLFSICLAQATSAQETADRNPSGDVDRDRQSLVSKVRPSLAIIRVADRDGQRSGIGSGFVIDAQGLIATNFHVIGEARSFTVELWPDRKLRVISVEASDRDRDLAVLRVDTEGKPLPALNLAETETEQGMSVLAFGNPFGLKHSVVQGIVSAMREVEGEQLIQMAMPIEPGNSGGPLVDLQGQVRGIVNMKSAVEQNLGFAIPIAKLRELLRHPNPIRMDRWVRRNGLDPAKWTTTMGALWSQRSGSLHVSGVGTGFGGRSLCLAQQDPPGIPYELKVQVRLQEESGAAGLVFQSDGRDEHYGFYPSGGNLRLSRFRGPDVRDWEVLSEKPSSAYLPGEWNELKVQVDDEWIRCYVNGKRVMETKNQRLPGAKLGLAKFRDTVAEFRRFEVSSGKSAPRGDQEDASLQEILHQPEKAHRLTADEIKNLSKDDPERRAERLRALARDLDLRSQQLMQTASDLQTASIVESLRVAIEASDASPLLGSLWVAKLDHAEIDIPYYLERVDAMTKEIQETFVKDDHETSKREKLNRYLFEENGFHGSRQEYYHSANCQMDRVIDDAEGMPIALCVLYMAIGNKLGMQMEGIGLPGHFVVRHTQEDRKAIWIDVFEKGRTLGNGELSNLVLANAGRPVMEEDLKPQTTQEIVTRFLRNLFGSAERQRDIEGMLRYTEALVAIHPTEPQYRLMRASVRRQAKRWSLAVEDIDWLIEHSRGRLDPHELASLRESLLQMLPD